jgi:hypothetical protein
MNHQTGTDNLNEHRLVSLHPGLTENVSMLGFRD